MKKYSLGIDFGSLSGRALLVEADTGTEVVSSVFDYPHGVMSDKLPSGCPLPLDYALQHPADYLEVLRKTIPDVISKAKISPDDIVGVGIDFTACTVIPVTKDGTPLCFLSEYENVPHAYVKLWKHHSAQKYADRVNSLATKRDEDFIKRYGGKISSEWMVPKVLEILEKKREIYDMTHRFMEAGDWIVLQLTGRESAGIGTAGYKSLLSKKDGYPSDDFYKALNPSLSGIIGTKLPSDIVPIGEKAGEINMHGAALTGLTAGTPVAVANIDAHAAFPALGIDGGGKMLMVMGTSTAHLVCAESEKSIPGICGVVEDGLVPGLFGYEAGQCCVGDHFEWFINNCVPNEYIEEAAENGVTIHKLLAEKADKLRAGQSGIIALDWWNGNRSILNDSDLTGIIIGMTLSTKAEEIYRALIEATAFGTRMIIENFEKGGVEINELYAAGGIAEKDTFLMQVYADITGREIKISGCAQAPALGSAIFGALAGGYYPDYKTAVTAMGKIKDKKYIPNLSEKAAYDTLFAEYKILHDYFGRSENNVMKKLKELRITVSK